MPPTTESLSEKGSDPLRRDQKHNENDSPPKGLTPFRIGSETPVDPADLPSSATGHAADPGRNGKPPAAGGESWESWGASLRKRSERRPLKRLFPDAVDGGQGLRWGLAAVCGKPVSPLQHALSEIACGKKLKKRYRSIDWELAAEEMLRDLGDVSASRKVDPPTVAEAVLWSYALPGLTERLSEDTWRHLAEALRRLARQCLADLPAESVVRLSACELAAVLRWRLGECDDPPAKQAVDGPAQWCNEANEAVDAAVAAGGAGARWAIASLLRTRELVRIVAGQKIKRRDMGTAVDLACWVAALTRADGTPALSTLSRSDIEDDLGSGGLLEAMKSLAPRLLGPAVDAVTGAGRTGGRLAWEVSLPESLWNSESSGLAVMLPEWDVRRGRTTIDYSTDDFRIEVELSREAAIRGSWEALIEIDGSEQTPAGPWTNTCEYTDDEVQYLEFEQAWNGGVSLQRQVMVLREERSVLLADAVIRPPDRPSTTIRYAGRVPVAESIEVQPEGETTEVWLADRRGKRRALALSPAANEWTGVRSSVRLDVTTDHRLRLQATTAAGTVNGGSVFAPLWLDFQPRRFTRPRTWRQLTVGDELRLVGPDEATAQRIQMGSEQWILYRSLRGERIRTFLGRHLAADFYCARFHAGDGSMEDLLTVGDDPSEPEA